MDLWTKEALANCGIHIQDPEDRQKLIEILNEETEKRVRACPAGERNAVILRFTEEVKANRERVMHIFLPGEMKTPLREIRLHPRTLRRLEAMGLRTLGDTLACTREELYIRGDYDHMNITILQTGVLRWLLERTAGAAE